MHLSDNKVRKFEQKHLLHDSKVAPKGFLQESIAFEFPLERECTPVNKTS